MKQTKISIFKNLFQTDVPYHVTLEKVFERIRSGKSLPTIQKIRESGTKEQRNSIKQSLPCIMFGGTFSERNKNGLISHSGLMVIDIDRLSTDELQNHFQELSKNPFILSVFVSPSGDGLKGVVRIPASDKHSHEKYFKAFNDEFKIPNWDKSNCNVDRVCYESYDPEIYINWDAVIYCPQIIDTGYSISEKKPLIPITDEDFIINKIMEFKWSKNFIEGQRNAYIFDIAGAFCEYGISRETAEGYILNNIVIGDFSDKEAITTIASAYKKRKDKANTLFFENHNKIERVKSDLKKGKKFLIETYQIDEQTIEDIAEVSENDDFWFVNEKGKISVTPFKYKNFLERNGFKKHFPPNSDKPQFVYVESNKVEITSIARIKDFVLNYLDQRKEREVWNYCANYQNLFSEQYLSMLESIELFMLNDEIDKSFVAFNNGILEVTKSGHNLIDYIDINGYIWKSHILNRDFISSTNTDNDYKKFINNISANNPLPFECTIGYLLSTHKNKSNNKAVILNDEIISDHPEGGTGKGLFVQGISQMRNTAIIDGKQFDSSKSFAYQTISLDTKLMVFDDVKKNFNFEEKFSLVTEGITLERKNKDAIKLSINESPKLIISTNYAIKGAGNSHDRRRHELEFAQYYGKNLTPDGEFGKQLFDEWDSEEYQKFDNYMIFCLQAYLANGLIEQNAKNIKLRRFIAETSMDFREFMSEEANFPMNTRNDKAVYFEKFVRENTDYRSWLKRNTFNKWVNKYADFVDKNFEQNSSNGIRWFGIFDSKEQADQEENDLYNEIFG